MGTEATITLLSRLVFGAIATFLAIILWSKTRDSAWMFVVIGTVVGYGEAVYSTLEAFGMAKMDLLVIYNVSVVRLVFANLPMIFYSIAFLIMVIRRSGR